MFYFHHHYDHHSVLKKNFKKEYQALVSQYGESNLELEKELTFSYYFKCWINDDGEDKPFHCVFDDNENTYYIVYDDEN